MDLNKFEAKIRLVDSFVENFSIENLKPPALHQNQEEKQADMTINYSITEGKAENGMRFGSVKLSLDIELSDIDGKCSTCRLVFTGLFDAEEDFISTEVFSQMLELNGIMILYQLSRSLITSVTAQAGINPPITLPLVNIHNIVKDKNENSEKEDESIK